MDRVADGLWPQSADDEAVQHEAVVETIADAAAELGPTEGAGRRRRDDAKTVEIGLSRVTRGEAVREAGGSVNFPPVEEQMGVLDRDAGDVERIDSAVEGRRIGVGGARLLRIAGRGLPGARQVRVDRCLVDRGQAIDPAGAAINGQRAIGRASRARCGRGAIGIGSGCRSRPDRARARRRPRRTAGCSPFRCNRSAGRRRCCRRCSPARPAQNIHRTRSRRAARGRG